MKRIAYELYQAPGLIGFQPGISEANSFNLRRNKSPCTSMDSIMRRAAQ